MTDENWPTETDQNLPSDPFNRVEPRAFINLLPTAFQGAIIEAYRAKPHLFGLTEREVYKLLRTDQKTPDPTDNRLRLQFWQEYEFAQANHSTKMRVDRICAGICQQNYFYERYIRNPYKLAWILTQPVGYETYLNEALQFGMEQLRDILEMPVIDSKGKIDTKLLELKAKITFALDARKNGAVVQRVEQKNMNLSISTTDKSIAQAALGGTMEDMEKRLKDLERQERKMLRLKEESEPRTVDVASEVKDVESS